MDSFEAAGRAIDRELKKLRAFFEGQVKPATQRRAVDALRAASRHLTKLAQDLERRAAQSSEKDAGKKE
jgi:hypothetical protein